MLNCRIDSSLNTGGPNHVAQMLREAIPSFALLAKKVLFKVVNTAKLF